MRVRVLGTLEARGDTRTVPVTGRLQRLLLATLTLNRARWVSGDAIGQILWPDELVANETRLHVHVHRLRAKLGAEAIGHEEGRYRLEPSAVSVDVWEFEDATAQAFDDHRHPARMPMALERLTAALGLWTGTPYAGIDQVTVETERCRLVEVYLLAQETRLQHLLDRGDQAAVLSEVAPCAREHPWRERLHALWATALLRVGDRAGAIKVIDAVSGALREELGIEPGDELGELRDLAARAGTTYPSASRPVDRATPYPAEPSAGVEEWARGRCEQARSLALRGRIDDALGLLGQAETIYAARGMPAERRATLRTMAHVTCLSGRLAQGLRLVRQAERVVPAGDPPDPGLALTASMILARMRRPAEAEEALARTEPCALPARERVLWWRARSQARRLRLHHEAAVEDARSAIELMDPRTPDPQRALAAVDLASALRDAGCDECFEWYGAAAELTRAEDARPLMALVHASWAKAWLVAGEPERATVHGRDALHHARVSSAWGFAGRAAVRLGDAADRLGEPLRAVWYRCEGLAHFRRVDYPVPAAERERLTRLIAAEA